jgi:outer membrane protein assembly factor BamB
MRHIFFFSRPTPSAIPKRNLLVGVAAILGAVALVVYSRAGVREIAAPAQRTTTEAAALAEARPGPNDWPWWRGSTRDGAAPASALPPTSWSVSENIAWKAEIPGVGHASPCIWGNRVFLATADEAAQTQSLVCVALETGRPLWNIELHRGELCEKHKKNSHASATPACDGTHIYTAFANHGAIWMSAIDLEGHIVWQREVGPYASRWGFGSSPLLYGDCVFVNGDNKGDHLDRLAGGASFLAALDRRSGNIVWRVKRPYGDSYGTPVIAKLAGRDQLLLSGKHTVISYDPANGRPFWTSKWEADRTASTLAFGDDRVFATVRIPGANLICLKADGAGDVSESHLAWSDTRAASDIPSPLFHEGRLYLSGDNGVMSCLAVDTGKSLWKKRLGGDFSASPIIANACVYVTNEVGTTFVLKAGDSFEQIAENALDEPILATPSVSGHRLLIRTAQHLYCIAEGAGATTASGDDDATKR